MCITGEIASDLSDHPLTAMIKLQRVATARIYEYKLQKHF